MTKASVPALRAETADNSRSDIPRGSYGEKDLNNDHSADGISPSSKSRSKGEPPAAARRHPSRLNDAAVQILQSKRPNAQKHGAFSMCSTIPGEDPREFQELHSDLIDEWQPSGPSEEDAVFSLADLMWRKRRVQRFTQAKLQAATFDARTPAYDETHGLALFAHFMATAPEIAFDCAYKFVSPEISDRLRQKYPRSSYQSTTDWAEAILTDIQSMLQPEAACEPGKEVDDLTEAVVEQVIEWKMVNTMDHAAKFLEDELKSLERLEAMIDRKTKHLMQLKAGKQMLGLSSPAREDEQPKRITARRGLQ